MENTPRPTEEEISRQQLFEYDEIAATQDQALIGEILTAASAVSPSEKGSKKSVDTYLPALGTRGEHVSAIVGNVVFMDKPIMNPETNKVESWSNVALSLSTEARAAWGKSEKGRKIAKGIHMVLVPFAFGNDRADGNNSVRRMNQLIGFVNSGEAVPATNEELASVAQQLGIELPKEQPDL